MRKPTLKDVAEAAGRPSATASRALDPARRREVTPRPRAGCCEAAESLGYRPNPIARSLKTARTRTIGLIIPDLTNPLFPPIVRGADEVLIDRGYSALIASTDNDPVREQRLVDSLVSRQVDGLIVATAQLEHPLLERLHQDGVKVVLINRRVRTSIFPSVVPDDASGIAQAVAHLAGLGHTRIAHLAGPQNTSTGVAPCAGLPARHARRRPRRRPVPDHRMPVLAGGQRRRGDGRVAGSRHRIHRGGGRQRPFALGCYDVFAERGIEFPGADQCRRVQRHPVPGQAAPTDDYRADPAAGSGRRGRAHAA